MEGRKDHRSAPAKPELGVTVDHGEEELQGCETHEWYQAMYDGSTNTRIDKCRNCKSSRQGKGRATRFCLIPVNSEDPPVFGQVPITLDVLNAAVGGWIERVAIEDARHEWGPLHGYINEEGKIKGLELNERATVLCAHVLSDDDYIAGPMIVLGYTTDGEEADLPEKWQRYLESGEAWSGI